jgi:hypothetical protein
MKQYRILYRWQERDYATTMPARDGNSARNLAAVTIMPGALIFAVEVAG